MFPLFPYYSWRTNYTTKRYQQANQKGLGELDRPRGDADASRLHHFKPAFITIFTNILSIKM